ncbi:phage tail sheath subtilisin-like domain-containing protein [Bacillus chungangensis]|uniref:Phage tail sheath protein n=1 Tax=Bacillus chungangensis TaxID=587633 RepID=A0ABT9WMJ7_9BACI|nr:phage tail sheath subtilisin-like domain-containing protein [Bacillus chungangensis]MDQ0174378.1 hypothetical protein [Bacillus chungangensis]
MAGGTWDPTSLPIQPGMYIRFRDAALAQISGGARGIVAMPLFEHEGTADIGKFYTIEREAEAIELFGMDYARPVIRVLQGGAKEVLVYAMSQIDDLESSDKEEAFFSVRDKYEAQHFNVFVYPDAVEATEQDASLAWCKRNRKEGKHFMVVYGGTLTEDQDPEVGNARSIRLADDYAVNLISGVISGSGTELSSGQFAPYIAGLIAGTPINQAITYRDIPVVDVTRRLKNSEVNKALTSGSLVLFHDGRKVKVMQGIVTQSDAGKRGKIRIMRARQAIQTDITATACDHYIGKIDNNEAGQASLISAVKAYLEMLETENVLAEPTVQLDPERPSKGDAVFLLISYIEVDSAERFFVTIDAKE